MVLFAAGQAYAQEQQDASVAAALTDESRARIEGQFEEIESLEEDVLDLSRRLDDSQGLIRTIYEARLMTLQTSLFERLLKLARDLAAEQQLGADVSAYKQRLYEDLAIMPDQATDAVERLDDTVRFNYAELGPREWL